MFRFIRQFALYFALHFEHLSFNDREAKFSLPLFSLLMIACVFAAT